MTGIGSTLNQRFTLEKELGRGGMGAVFRAVDQVLGRSVAIKTLKDPGGDEVGKKIRLEAQILARLLHENVVRLYDFGVSDGTYFLVMEEVEGTSFSKRWRNLPMITRMRVCAQVAEALDYAHHQGVIHRDVKPANVLLTASDQAKLSDFGLSVTAEEAEESGTIRGTPHYMSPEQARGKRLDYRTDLYSLGVMLYECATGAVPFAGQALAVIAQHVSAPPKPPRFKNPEILPTFEALILSLLAKNPDDRPPSGDAVAKRLREEIERERLRGRTSRLPDDPESVSIDGISGLEDTSDTPPRASASPAAASLAQATPPSVVSRQSIRASSELAREMLETILSEPIELSANDRYLCGHYLAYLLGGSRRQGIFLQRPLDPRNADRARLLLSMTWLMHVGPGGNSLQRAAELLDAKADVRPALNPVVVLKYLASRQGPKKRKDFRMARKLLQETSRRAQSHMLAANGVLNPGLMPQSLEDLRIISPIRSEIDDQLVNRWNRVSEVWRENFDFREAVLRYVTTSAYRDPASADLWPEVVYPLIERARWQRELSPKHEQIWDYVSAKVLRVPDAGVLLDRAIVQSVPVQVAEMLSASLVGFVDDPRIEDEAPAKEEEKERMTVAIGKGVSIQELTTDTHPADRAGVILTPPDPYRFSQADLRDLWTEAMASLGKPGVGHRNVPVGPYRLAVIPSVRGRSAGQVALSGMGNKQIEMITPSIRAGGSSGKPLIAVWIYQDASAVLVYLDFKAVERYILWHAPNAQQFNYDDPGELNHMLFTLAMEQPDQLGEVLSKRFRPRSPA